MPFEGDVVNVATPLPAVHGRLPDDVPRRPTPSLSAATTTAERVCFQELCTYHVSTRSQAAYGGLLPRPRDEFHIYGVTSEGVSVLIHVLGYRHAFYLVPATRLAYSSCRYPIAVEQFSETHAYAIGEALDTALVSSRTKRLYFAKREGTNYDAREDRFLRKVSWGRKRRDDARRAEE